MASGGPSVGLKFDLKSWGKGVRDAKEIMKKGLDGKVATGGLSKGLKGFRASAGASFKKVGGMLKGALTSGMAPLAALFAGGAILAGLKSVLSSSLDSFRGYQDSVTQLNAALKATGETNLSKAREEVKALGDTLRISMGVGGAETNSVFSDFLTSGFDQSQAKQLTVLAANFAQKTGRPLQDVAKQIGEAANGSVDALKELGIQIPSTGNAVRDAENAVIAMKESYGTIGTDLVNPTQLLNANLENLRVTLGERISPLIEPLIQGVSDFVTGLTKSDEGREILDGIAESLEFSFNWIGQIIVQASNLVEMAKSAGAVIKSMVELYLNTMATVWFTVADKILSHPLMQWLFGKLGLDTSGIGQMAEGFKENMKLSLDDLKKNSSDFMRAQGEFMRGESDTGLLGGFNKFKEAGAAIREEETKKAQSMLGEGGFSGAIAQKKENQRIEEEKKRAEEERQRALAAEQKRQMDAYMKQQEQRRELVSSQNARFNGAADFSGGMSLSINLKNKRGNRFRKA